MPLIAVGEGSLCPPCFEQAKQSRIDPDCHSNLEASTPPHRELPHIFPAVCERRITAYQSRQRSTGISRHSYR